MPHSAPTLNRTAASDPGEARERTPDRRVARPSLPEGPIQAHGVFLLALLAIVWTWWAWKQGAFFGTVALPGVVILCGGAIILALTAPWQGRLSLSMPARAALVALVALAAWTLASAIWSPAPDIALADAQRVFGYALAFGLGIWLCNLMGTRIELVFLPLAIAGAVVAVATTITLLAGHDLHAYLETDGTLQFPLGYRNANAAFFLIALWPALGLAMTKRIDWRLRGLALAAATLCLELGLLSQSRGAALAGLAAVIVFLLASHRRGSAFGWLLVAAAPALVVVPHLSQLYHASGQPGPSLETVHAAAGAAAVGAGIALVAGAVVARFGGLEAPRLSKRLDRAVTVGLVIAPLAGLIAFVLAFGSPTTWIGQRVTQFDRGESPALRHQTTRFGFNTGTGRGDLWRVALLEGGKHPLLGDGAGGYGYAYLRERDSPETTARDAHSVELETLSELGVPGLALLVIAIAGAGAGVVRARRLGPAAASVATVALAAGAYWLVHTSIDWFWPYPAVTAPVLCLAGAACAPAVRALGVAPRRAPRRFLVAASALLALSAIPPFLSANYLGSAFAEWRHSLPGAYSDLDAAARWNPLSEDPPLAEGAIAKAAGDHRRAIDAFSRAAAKRPEDWAPHYYLAELYAGSAPGRARDELATALRLDPREPILDALRQRLDATGR